MEIFVSLWPQIMQTCLSAEDKSDYIAGTNNTQEAD